MAARVKLASEAAGLQGMYSAYAPGAMGSAQMGSAEAMSQGKQLAGSTAGDLPYAQQALATGFNANNALYNTELGAITDQTRAAEAARGISMSPYGAGVEGNTLMNFNQQWQQQQLQNQATAAGTAATLQGANTQAVSAGGQLELAGAMLPTQALSSIMQAGAIPGQELNESVQDFLSYLSTISSPQTQKALGPSFGPPSAEAFGIPIYGSA